jgi:hypothetical protein
MYLFRRRVKRVQRSASIWPDFRYGRTPFSDDLAIRDVAQRMALRHQHPFENFNFDFSTT